MKHISKFFAFFLLPGLLLHVSCKKRVSCENCNDNKPPIAYAGPDRLITLPTDSVSLDGILSRDPGGKISNYLWRKITGPASFAIINSSTSITVVKNLTAGVYEFELKVTDNVGLFSMDTTEITVKNPEPNRPPTAVAGGDQAITLPKNSVLLDGSASWDPDNNIASYEWTRISGSQTSIIINTNSVQTQVVSLAEGVYSFQLKVTDSAGLSSTDTIQIVVDSDLLTCPPFDRPIINAQLVPLGELSEPRIGVSVAAVGNKLFYAGGKVSSGAFSSTVDIYDILTQSWSKAQLSIPRMYISGITVGKKIYFAGGLASGFSPIARIDIYDAVSNTWSTQDLSEPRWDLAAATVGNKIFFAGGNSIEGPPAYNINYSKRVDIYDISTNIWSTASLHTEKIGLSATVANNKIYFAGGYRYWDRVYDNIDIYDNTTNSWHTGKLKEPKANHGSIAVGNHIYWAGGERFNNSEDIEATCKVEIRDLLNGTSTTRYLSQPGSNKAFLKSNSIIFYSGSNQFDIYSTTSDVWSIGVMNQQIHGASAISINDVIYIAGGRDLSNPISHQVWKLVF